MFKRPKCDLIYKILLIVHIKIISKRLWKSKYYTYYNIFLFIIRKKLCSFFFIHIFSLIRNTFSIIISLEPSRFSHLFLYKLFSQFSFQTIVPFSPISLRLKLQIPPTSPPIFNKLDRSKDIDFVYECNPFTQSRLSANVARIVFKKSCTYLCPVFA